MKGENYEQPVFKIVVVGHSGVGKTSLVHHFIKGTFKLDYNVTIGVEYYTKTVKSENTLVHMQIWDTAGQEVYKSIVRSFYRGASGVLVIFAIDSQQTMNAAKQWVKEVKQLVHQETCLFLVGTKLDKASQRQVSSESAQKYMNSIGGASYIETSAKTGQNVQQLFNTVGSMIMKKYKVNKQFRELVSPNQEKEAKRKQTNLSGKSFSLRRPSVAGPNLQKKKCC